MGLFGPAKWIEGGREYDDHKSYVQSYSQECTIAELNAEMQEAWKLVNAMAGQEPWDRAEEWLKKNERFKPEGIQRV